MTALDADNGAKHDRCVAESADAFGLASRAGMHAGAQKKG
jgi:hypothetical protein